MFKGVLRFRLKRCLSVHSQVSTLPTLPQENQCMWDKSHMFRPLKLALLHWIYLSWTRRPSENKTHFFRVSKQIFAQRMLSSRNDWCQIHQKTTRTLGGFLDAQAPLKFLLSLEKLVVQTRGFLIFPNLSEDLSAGKSCFSL